MEGKEGRKEEGMEREGRREEWREGRRGEVHRRYANNKR